MMKRKLYEKPSMKVFKLKQKPTLLAGSNGGAGVYDYNWNNVPEE